MQGIGTILNRWKPYDLRFLRLKIIVQQILEASQNIFIHMAASNKLPVIKPNAIIQEQFYIIYNQCLAMLIDSMLQFRLYIMKTIENYFSFLFRQMKRLIRFIRKESIILHLAYKRSTPYQIRVEQKSPALRLEIFSIIDNPYNLSRSQKNKRSFLIIIIIPTITNIPTFHIFQKNSIKTKPLKRMQHRLAFRKIDNAD